MPRAREPEQLFRIPNPESPIPALKNEYTDMAHFELVEKMAPNANIKVIGVGGGGGNAVAHMVNIEKIGGTIELSSVEGRGTKFVIKIPLTLAIVSALIVECASERFAIPQL